MNSDEDIVQIQGKAKYRLPPDDIPFTSLYVYNDDAGFESQPDYIQLTDTYERKSADRPQRTGLLRYMKTAIGQVKYDPDRPKKRKIKL